MNEIIQYQEPQTAVAIRAQVNLVQEVMKAVMKDGTHYGVIPGTPKPSLWKPGAEILASTFRIAVSYKIEDLSTAEVVRYRVTAIGKHQTTDIVMGEGMGECSSGEEKYKWRKSVNANEFNSFPEDRRRIKYGKQYDINQVRTEPADLANTILKMACKRAQVAMVLNVTAASDIFTQDIEDLPVELRPAGVDTETGEIHDNKPKKPEPLTEEVFNKHQAGWKKSIVAGRKTLDDLVNFVFAQGAFLTDEQKNVIRSWVQEPDVAAYSYISRQLESAKTRDELDLAADLIQQCKEKANIPDLEELYKRRCTDFEG